MKYRKLGRTGWSVSEIGYGMWGMGGWSGSDDAESLASLQKAVDLGCNFFDTAWVYGNGHSETLLGKILHSNPGKRLFAATKVPPKNMRWPSRSEYTLDECYPSSHVEEYVHRSLSNLGTETIDLLQFHTWNDTWAENDGWLRTFEDLKRRGLIRAAGLSLNRWEPWNGVKAVRSGGVDAVQVIYNIFDQNPEDELFPACAERDVAVIARVPFDEGSLTGTLTQESRWPEGDWRNTYFTKVNLEPTLNRVGALKQLLPAGMTLPQMALNFILENPSVSTIIPGMRKTQHVASNFTASDANALPDGLYRELRKHRWVRKPAPWSD
jgi:aryl-alcohol dehydrogenase-like predicted oxidoreductase